MRASKIMQERVLKNPKIEILWNSETEEILGGNEVEGMRLYNNKTGERKEIPIRGFFVAIGHAPATELFKGQLEMKPSGYLITKPDSTATSIPGVYAAGDVKDDIFRQAVTAAGMGCMAALEVERFFAGGH